MREFRSVIGPKQSVALRYIAVHPHITIPQLAFVLDMSYGNARRIMLTLEERGLVRSLETPRAILWSTTMNGERLAE